MLFNSLEFAAFFAVVFGLYALFDHRKQNHLLLAASYIFYGMWDYRFLALLAASTLVDYYVALALSRQNTPLARKRLLWVSIGFNLSVLGFFKYFGFFSSSFVDLASAFGLTLSPVTLNILLPVGISFYTFQSMGYVIDVYRGKTPPTRKLSEFALYVAFFPQLVAGPIERARRLLPQIASPRTITAGKIGTGLALILLGLFKKVVVADNLAGPVDRIFASPEVTGELVVMGSLYFTFQIYCDFSGYSDMARGLARMLGFELMVNFRQPFFAKDVAEVLRRWHISLSTWLRDYLFQSLGGVRRNQLLTARNLIVTMLLAGLWHGAAWNFVLWGLFVGLALAIYRLYDVYCLPRVDRLLAGRPGTAALRNVAARVIFLLGMLYGFMIFRATGLAQIIDMTAALGRFESVLPMVTMTGEFLALTWPIILLDLYEYRKDSVESLVRAPLLGQVAAYSYVFLLFVTIGKYDARPFVYFQF